jgi:outer membrane protein assembly factor BamE (lipoprotein component of BamABCDE complex)
MVLISHPVHHSNKARMQGKAPRAPDSRPVAGEKNDMKKIALMFAAMVFLTGCATAGRAANWDKARQVKVGMSEPEVTALMGSPYMVSSRDSGQRWIWTYVNGFTGAVSTMTVDWKDGKVVSVPVIPSSFK